MKKVLITITMFVALSFTTKSAQAQLPTTGDILIAAGNLVNVQIGDVAVNLQDITITDVIDVSNVLNNNTVTVTALNNFLNNIRIDNVLNNLLRNADVLTNNQIVVGILSDGTFLIADRTLFPILRR